MCKYQINFHVVFYQVSFKSMLVVMYSTTEFPYINPLKLYVPPALTITNAEFSLQCICGYYMILRVNSDYFFEQP
jgi:hypothetical protein